jgi:two-component system chemotaxis sensor kinase CheA
VSADLVTAVLAAIDAIKAILRALESDGKEPAGDDAALIARLDAVANGKAALDPEPAPELVLEEDEPPVVEAETGPRAQQTIRVSVELLEHLMTTVSELVLTRNQLVQVARRGGDTDALNIPFQRLSQCVSELQDGIMRTRMQPVSNAWSMLPRLARSLALDLHKRIDLEMHGGETELDRQVLELIKDPLAHMLRNAADHGIETPAERLASGKRDTGRIRLNAFQEGGQIVIEMTDDGRGIDTDRLRDKAVENSLLRPSEAVDLTRAQALRLVFHPGLSTAHAVTSVSGRGVGMDVVKANIEKIGGSVDVDSTPGRGTRFTLRIPLTLAIVPALVVAAGGERFAVPQMAVNELVRVGDEHRIETLPDAQVLRLRDRLLPLVDLAELLGLPVGDADERYVVVAQAGGFAFGIVVDELFDTEEIVVKPVAPILAGLAAYSGNAILGDGRVIMILDVNGVATVAGVRGDVEEPEAEADAVAAPLAERDSMLLFRTGRPTPLAVPLSLVARLEDIPVERIELGDDRPVIQYRGDIMPILTVDAGHELRATGRQPILVFTDGARNVGLAVEEVVDIVEDVIDIRLSAEMGGRLGSAVIAGAVTEVLDVGYYLDLGSRSVARPAGSSGVRAPARVLVVDDSAFFRNMLRPLLSAAGYEVSVATSAEEALRLREEGQQFDLILSDIEMPGLSGLDFAQAVRVGGTWAQTPMIALSSLANDVSKERGRAAGFDEYVAKFDRMSLLSILERRLLEAA